MVSMPSRLPEGRKKQNSQLKRRLPPDCAIENSRGVLRKALGYGKDKPSRQLSARVVEACSVDTVDLEVPSHQINRY